MGKEYERQLLLGKKIKKFNLVEELGSGSFGTVYKAVDTKTDEIHAIKVMSKKQMKEIPKLQKLVRSEIEILQQVKSENIIKFVESFSSGDNVFIVTEFCNGGDLQDYCRKKGKLPQSEAVNFLKQILNGFKGLHEINTMHRDFKLANVLLHNHVCKIADLGFAKQLKDKALTITQLGTDQTMAPEVHQGQKYGWGADIWSIGVVFYQMLYGRLPYTGLNDWAILRNIKTTTPKYDDVDVSQEAVDFIQRCLVYNPKQRISWKQVYEHPLLYKSDITLTTGLLRCSRINLQRHKNYYDKNEQEKRKTVKYDDSFDVFSFNLSNKKEKDIFQSAGEIKSADNKADQIWKNKEQIQKEFEDYETLIIQERNNKMFGLTQVLPLEKEFQKIEVSHALPLYQICKNTYIQLKKLRQQVTCKQSKSYKGFKFWKEFKEEQVYRNLCDQLLEDEIFAESLTISYKFDIGNEYENMNRPSETGNFRNIIGLYRRQLTPFLKKQSKKNKLKYIKMLKALKCMEETSTWNHKVFNEQNQSINVQSEQKYLLSHL